MGAVGLALRDVRRGVGVRAGRVACVGVCVPGGKGMNYPEKPDSWTRADLR